MRDLTCWEEPYWADKATPWAAGRREKVEACVHLRAVNDSISPPHMSPPWSRPSLTRAANWYRCRFFELFTWRGNWFIAEWSYRYSISTPRLWCKRRGLRYYNWKASSIVINNEVSLGSIRGWGRECVRWKGMFSHISSQPVNPPLSESWREYDTGVKTQEGESLTLLHYESTGTGLCMT